MSFTKKLRKQYKSKRGLVNTKVREPKRILVFVGLFVILSITVAVARSFAATVPSSASGYVKHLNQSGYGYTSSKSVRITSDVHRLCVATTFDTFDSPFNASYYWALVWVYKGKEYERRLKSPKISGNGNRDHYCFQDSTEILKGGIYNVRFRDTNGSLPPDIHGSYSIWGYSHD